MTVEPRTPIKWEDYCMAVAFLAAERSEDPNINVGACVVDSKEKRIVGIGYNCMPERCTEPLPWDREGVPYHETKYPYVVHAATKAIIDCKDTQLKGCQMYISVVPCNDCAKLIIEAGIEEIVYLRDKYKNSDQIEAAKRLFKTANIPLTQYSPTENITIDFSAFLNDNASEAMDCG